MKKISRILLPIPLILAFVSEYAFLKHYPLIGGFLLLGGFLTLILSFRLGYWGDTIVLCGMEKEESKRRLLLMDVAIVLFVSVIASLLFITSCPLIVDGDASSEAMAVERILESKPSPLNLSIGEMTNSYLYILGAFLKPFNDKLLGLRLFSAIGGILSTLFFFLFSKNIINRRMALISSLVLTTSPFFILFTRSGLELIYILAMMIASLWLLTFKKFKIIAFFVAGLLIGFSQYVGAAAKFIPIIVCIYLAIDFIGGGKKKIVLFCNFLVLLIGLLITYLPLAVNLKKSGIGLNNRLGQVSIFKHETMVSGSLTEKKNLITTQLYRTIGAFFYPHGHLGLYYSRSPYLYYLPASLMLLGVVVCLATLKHRGSVFFIVWFIVGSFLTIFLTIDTPKSSRDIVILPAICIFIALGLNYIILVAKKVVNTKFSDIYGWLLVLIFVLYNTFSSFHYLNNEYVRHSVPNDLIASFAGRHIRASQPDYIYLLNNDFYFRYDSIPSLPFVSGRKGINIESTLDRQFLSNLPAGKYCWIVLDTRSSELEILKNFYISNTYKVIQIKSPDGIICGYIFDVSV